MITHNGFLLVTTHEDSSEFVIDMFPEENIYELCYMHKIDDEESGFYGEWEEVSITLPPGTWQLIGLAAELTEEQKKEIVQRWAKNIDTSYRNYEWPNGPHYFHNPSDSLASLLRSHNLNPSTTVILKQVEA